MIIVQLLRLFGRLGFSVLGLFRVVVVSRPSLPHDEDDDDDQDDDCHDDSHHDGDQGGCRVLGVVRKL